MFEYTQQPPSTTLNCCNPYQDGFITIVLECIVRHQTNEFQIQWFRENTTGAVEELGLGFPNRSQGQGSMHWFSWYHESDFLNQQYNPSYLGKYWCQVINTTADPDQPLMRSNVFTLLAPENYTQPTCVSQNNVTQIIENIACADLPVHSEQTTLPAPTTTLSSLDKLICKIPDSTTEAKNTCSSMTGLSLTNATSGSYVTNITSSTISPASPTASVLLIVYPVAAVLSAVIVIVSLISVTVILLLVKRQRIKKRG